MSFQVQLDAYAGPLDLLLHIVRREEIPLAELPLARIVDQYLDYLEVLVELSIDDVADFLEIASLLVEMKSKQAIPQNEEEPGAEIEESLSEASDELVYRLMEYKRIRDAASILEEQGDQWQLRYTRLSNELPSRPVGTGEHPIEPIEVWDLVSAFGRILRERQPPQSAKVIYDETPIHEYMKRIHQRVAERQRVELTSLFEAGMHKSALVAMFLATLELTRHHGLGTEQRSAGEPLFLVPTESFQTELEVHQVDNLSADRVRQSNLPIVPR
ncbi:MAG: segregation/condensation protein A [bacterium]|nr:segregation/condensation protein A [bacterium]